MQLLGPHVSWCELIPPHAAVAKSRGWLQHGCDYRCGDHGCEYMTGGTAVIIGTVGKNFGAGMSGGVAYVYDAEGNFADMCNEDVKGDLEPLAEEADVAEVRALLEKHVELTGSVAAQVRVRNSKIRIAVSVSYHTGSNFEVA